MEETASYCSGSPERTALYTPVSRSTGDCYTQVMGQSPYLLGDGFGYEFDDVDHPFNHHIRQATAPNFQSAKLGLGLSPLHDTIAKTYEQPYKGFHSFEWDRNKVQSHRDLEDWTAASTRFLKLADIDPSISSTALFSYLHDVGDVQDYNTARLRSDGVCIVSYFDLRDAIAAYIKIKSDQNWTIQYCSQAYYSVLISNEGNYLSSLEISEIICAITSGPQLPNAAPVLYNCLHDFGTIHKFTTLKNAGLPTFLVSFHSHQTASDLVDTLDGQYLMGFHLTVALFDREPSSHFAVPETYHCSTGESMHHQGCHDIWSPHPVRPRLDTPFASIGFSPRSERDSPNFDAEPTSSGLFSGIYSCSRGDMTRDILGEALSYDKADWEPQAQERLHRTTTEASAQHSPCRSAHSQCVHSAEISSQKDSSSALGGDKTSNQITVPGKNIIDLDRIARGLDTRTTVMLRNIPNKVDQQTLKEYIDETSRGLYNFLYLRIDFRNICNVGYAFINFLDFVKTKSGTRWNKFNSEKVLDVTYASIDQLVEKFRNSSVMDQDPAYRPKLFYSSGPLAGTEMEFPAANNILKKCRSISAAQQIGLFAPKLSAASKGIWRKRD
ncbi:hypothetical protein K440DRAFT_660214 [Wilcoxina mikolae CBS 423.85]|nr:hypothetical protein K440DRAFT_660214 [Wilcoxina mikolae CBS 423.85]